MCRTTFLFLPNTGHFVHKAIRKSCRENGLEDTLKSVSSFIVNYAEDHAIQLPRRMNTWLQVHRLATAPLFYYKEICVGTIFSGGSTSWSEVSVLPDILQGVETAPAEHYASKTID